MRKWCTAMGTTDSNAQMQVLVKREELMHACVHALHYWQAPQSDTHSHSYTHTHTHRLMNAETCCLTWHHLDNCRCCGPDATFRFRHHRCCQSIERATSVISWSRDFSNSLTVTVDACAYCAHTCMHTNTLTYYPGVRRSDGSNLHTIQVR